LLEFATKHQLKIGTIADLIHYRSRTESLVRRITERMVDTVHGKFKLVAYSDKTASAIHLALVKGEIVPGEETLVRVHAPLSVMDLLDIGSGGHTWSIYDAQKTIAAAGKGIIVLLQSQDGSDELLERVRPGRSSGKKQSGTDLRNYGIGMQILKDLNVTKMRLLAAPRKMPSMAGFGLEVTGYELPDKK
jgi:3,4-dihydroxy 2-butanone 4-phosphate synthase/GTP cyclohydrolase II